MWRKSSKSAVKLSVVKCSDVRGNGEAGDLNGVKPNERAVKCGWVKFNPYPTVFPYGNSMVLHFYQQQGSSTNKTVHKVINKGLKAYV